MTDSLIEIARSHAELPEVQNINGVANTLNGLADTLEAQAKAIDELVGALEASDTDLSLLLDAILMERPKSELETRVKDIGRRHNATLAKPKGGK